jgi:hypothetical protein
VRVCKKLKLASAPCAKLYQMDFRGKVARAKLADANDARD